MGGGGGDSPLTLAAVASPGAVHVDRIEQALRVAASKDLLIDFCLDSMSDTIH